MDFVLIKILTRITDDKYSKNNYKKFYSNEYYLDNIFKMLDDINKWKILIKLKSYEHVIINDKIDKTRHDTIIINFVKWVNDGIFKLAFDD